MTETFQVFYDPQGLVDEELPLDRTPHMLLVQAVLAWPAAGPRLPERDCQQIALLLTGHARAVAEDLRRHCAALDDDSESRTLTETVLAETTAVLARPILGTARCVQERARLIRALYERLDRIAPAVAS